MAFLVKDDNSLFRVESICWSCTEAYADKCKFHTYDCPWEERLEIPSRVAARETSVPSKSGREPKQYFTYKVLECPSYRPSARKKKELLREKREKQNVLSKTNASKLVLSRAKSGKPVPSINTKGNAQGSCIICGAPAAGKLYCSSLCKAMGSGLNVGGSRR